MFIPTNYNIEFEVENGSRDRMSILSITFDIFEYLSKVLAECSAFFLAISYSVFS